MTETPSSGPGDFLHGKQYFSHKLPQANGIYFQRMKGIDSEQPQKRPYTFDELCWLGTDQPGTAPITGEGIPKGTRVGHGILELLTCIPDTGLALSSVDETQRTWLQEELLEAGLVQETAPNSGTFVVTGAARTARYELPMYRVPGRLPSVVFLDGDDSGNPGTDILFG